MALDSKASKKLGGTFGYNYMHCVSKKNQQRHILGEEALWTYLVSLKSINYVHAVKYDTPLIGTEGVKVQMGLLTQEKRVVLKL